MHPFQKEVMRNGAAASFNPLGEIMEKLAEVL